MHYPDFLAPQVMPYWRRQLASLRALVPWDGLWIDMNEASNFCTGEVWNAGLAFWFYATMFSP